MCALLVQLEAAYKHGQREPVSVRPNWKFLGGNACAAAVGVHRMRKRLPVEGGRISLRSMLGRMHAGGLYQLPFSKTTEHESSSMPLERLVEVRRRTHTLTFHCAQFDSGHHAHLGTPSQQAHLSTAEVMIR